MKQKLCLILLSISLLAGCIKETKTVSKESNNSGNNYEVPSCVYTNTCVGGTTSGGSGGTGGTTPGGTPPGQNPGFNQTSDPNWGVDYLGGSKSLAEKDRCEPAKGDGLYDTRIVTVTSAGGFNYSPVMHDIKKFKLTSPYLLSLSSNQGDPSVKQLFSVSDSVLKLRFKVRPEPYSAGSKLHGTCYGRLSLLPVDPKTGKPVGATTKGYTQLKFQVDIYGVKANAPHVRIKSEIFNPITINECSHALNLSYDLSRFDYIFFDITEVFSNTLNWPTDYDTNGWLNGNSFQKVPNTKCWSMDVEVAYDGSKDFN